jgi:putative sterol carrier protein
MTAATTQFFDELARRGHEPVLGRVSGTLRVDLEHGTGIDHWLVAIDRGDLGVSRKNVKADCVLRTDADLFDDIAAGRVNAIAAVLRGAVILQGDLELAVLFQRLFPGPPGSRDPRRVAEGGRRQS